MKKPRWKTTVELALYIFGLLIGAYMASSNWTWPPTFPQWVVVIVGLFLVFAYLDKVHKAWGEL